MINFLTCLFLMSSGLVRERMGRRNWMFAVLEFRIKGKSFLFYVYFWYF